MAVLPAPSPLSRFGFFVLVGSVVLIGIFWGILQYLADHQPKSHAVNKPLAKVDLPAPSVGGQGSPAAAATADPEAVAKLRETIAQALAVLRDPAISNKAGALDALRATLRQAEPKVAIAAIRQFLNGGEDAATGLGFKLGEGHELDEAPSMRTFLMDQLGVFSRDIAAADAAEVARATLETKSSPDEWALAMRNLGWADPAGSKALLAAKASELINYAPWQQAPTGGYYEAFDAAAYSGDPNLVGVLAPLATAPSSVQRASQIALQRLSAMAPDAVAGYLNTHPDVLADSPGHRADYMGSVDLASADGLTQAETYLNRADVTLEEKNKFLARLGTPAGFVSPTLLTPENIVSMPLLDHRALVNTTASNWLAAGKFPALQPALQSLVQTTGR